MRLYRLKIAAGEVFDLAAYGDYVLVRSSAVDLIIESPETGEFIEVSQGDDFQFERFSRLRISHEDGAEQAIKLIISTGKRAGSAKVGGSVTVSGAIALDAGTLAALESVELNAATINGINTNNADFAHVTGNFTNVNAGVLVANANRKYFFIQNNDASNVLRVQFGGAASAVAGLRLLPGESYESVKVCAKNSVNVCFEAATLAGTNNVEVITG